MKPPKNRRDSARKYFFIIIVCLVVPLACLVGIGYFGFGPIDIGPASREAEATAAQYRKAGFPWEAKDLAPNPPVKPEENAAPMLEEAVKALDKPRLRHEAKELDDLAEKGDWAVLAVRLRPYERARAIASRGAERPGFDLHSDMDLDVLGLGDAFQKNLAISSLVEAFCLTAELEAGRKDLDGCCRDLNRAWKLTGFVEHGPDMLAILQSELDGTFAIDATKRCATLYRNDVEALKRLASTMGTSDAYDLRRAFRGDSYHSLVVLRNADSNPLSKLLGSGGTRKRPSANDVVRTGLPRGAAARAAATRHMQFWIAAKPLMDKYADDPVAMGHALNGLSVSSGRDVRLSKELAGGPSLENFYDQIGRNVADAVARKRIARALLAALIVKAKTGLLPTRMSEVPGSWIDPYSKEPLHLIGKPNSILVYSVGPNGKDDGGRSEASRDSAEGGPDDRSDSMDWPRSR